MKKLLVLLLLISLLLNVGLYLKKDVGYLLSTAIAIGCHSDPRRNAMICNALLADETTLNFKYSRPPRTTLMIDSGSFEEASL